MINGVRVRDSGVELSPTGTDRVGEARERHPTARFELLRQSRARIDAVAHAADQTATFGQSGGMASVGGLHRWLANWPPGHSRPVMASSFVATGPLLRIS
jgi:hypothetical protein